MLYCAKFRIPIIIHHNNCQNENMCLQYENIIAVSVIVITAGLIFWKQTKRSGQRDGAGKVAVTAGAGTTKNYLPGQVLTMGFRRTSFVWTEHHIPGSEIKTWESFTDQCDSIDEIHPDAGLAR